MWKKQYMELLMACLLLGCFYYLSRRAAVTSCGREDTSVVQHKEQEAEKPIIMENPSQEKPVIVLDAGHGGMDPGMTGEDGLEEKGINLAIADLLADQLQQQGYPIVKTRDSDKGLYEENSTNKKARDLQKRIEVIREAAAVAVISIHQNSYPDPQVKGPQVFYYEDSDEGRQLALCVQEELNASLEVQRPRSAKGNRSYYLLKKSPCTAIIVECGFLTNPEEAELLQTKAYQEKAACAIARGVCRYLDVNNVF